MRLPETPGAARRLILAGGAVVLVVLGALLGARPLQHEIAERRPAPVPECVRTPESSSPTSTEVPQLRADPARGVPLSIEIPELGVEAVVTPVALAETGVLVPPSDHTTVGWWAQGARPGSRSGAALVTGHAVRDGDGAFDDLARLQPGSVVRVTTGRGRITYLVDAVEDYTKEQLARASAQVFSQTGTGRLVLVTCSDYYAGSYHGNVVVIAHPRQPVSPLREQ